MKPEHELGFDALYQRYCTYPLIWRTPPAADAPAKFFYPKTHRAEPSVITRFFRNVTFTGSCWVKGKTGLHQRFGAKKRKYPAHRWIFEQIYGPLPADIFACHHCDNPPCVNPAHLFPGTAKDNWQDAVNKGRINPNPFKSA